MTRTRVNRPDGQAAGSAGFTLIEILAVIMILGFLVGMVLPFAGHMDNRTKTKRTVEIFEEIRQAILGARGATDAQGLPVVGGYAGDTGHLPRLYVYAWDNGENAWTHPDADSDTIPDPTHNAAAGAIGDANAQPAGLWCKLLARMDDGTGGFASGDLHEASDSNWKGPYLATPRDSFPDDQVYIFITGASSADDLENNRRFCLRACEGRLSDGWGQAFIIYVEDTEADTDTDPDMNVDIPDIPLNLVFVSPGPDGSYDAADPADSTRSGNADNLVFRITLAEWDQTARKTAQTKAMLERMARGILGPDALKTGGETMRTGFIADMGDPGPLCGSVVEYNGSAYRCIKTHTAELANQPIAGGNTWWIELSSDAAVEYPLAVDWQAGEVYYRSTPELLLVHADYVTHSGVSYRCTDSHTASSSNEPGTGASWEIDNSVDGPEWVSGTEYYYYAETASDDEMIPAWQYYSTCQMGAGWRGPYMPPQEELPLADAWGNAVEISMDAGRNLTLKSCGPDGTGGNVDDDITVFIPRTAYELPVQVNVANYTGTPAVSVAVTDMVDVYAPYNGQIRLRRAWPEAGDIGTGPGGTTRFRFNTTDVAATGILPPVPPELWNALIAPVRSETADTPSVTDPGASAARYARTWLPMGRCYIVYRDDASASITGESYGSPSPVTDPALPGYAGFNGLGPSGYQRSCLLHPGTDTHIQLGP